MPEFPEYQKESRLLPVSPLVVLISNRYRRRCDFVSSAV